MSTESQIKNDFTNCLLDGLKRSLITIPLQPRYKNPIDELMNPLIVNLDALTPVESFLKTFWNDFGYGILKWELRADI